ncbi:MAG: p-cumate dioxygenase [Rhodospirillaceae bacterium]|nr:p-cumate dioxygenase [Rhodospirillaceae bacterium]|tara:strand:+ start:5177 stop:5668 length:492 start_codon:yes stop_codon:yes gene_type:complete
MSAVDISRHDVEEFLFEEAALLDEWRLDEWLELLTEDATYQIPSNDAPDSDARNALFLIADDAPRIKARVKRLNDSEAHAESPRSRTRRLIANVRITNRDKDILSVSANFSVFRYRRNAPLRQYVGRYEYQLNATGEALRIAERRVILDPTELGTLGAVSFIL